jgi:hypothetical protein
MPISPAMVDELAEGGKMPAGGAATRPQFGLQVRAGWNEAEGTALTRTM